MKKLFFAIICIFSFTCISTAQEHRIKVVASLFPLYDFARNIAGERADVELLLPPGAEPHHFEPSPRDMLKIAKADVFIYTGAFMEPWAADIVKGVNNPALVVIDVSRGVSLLSGAVDEDGDHEHGSVRVDPHIWLDFGNDKVIIDNIASGLIMKDPGNKDLYLKNAGDYKLKLDAIDDGYTKALTGCANGALIYAGHAAFGYLAKRYGLEFIPANPGFSSDAEPSPRRLAELSELMRRRNIAAVYCERLSSCRLARTIASETGAAVMVLNPGHNLTADEFKKGITFLQMMEDNLASLKAGLACGKR